MSAAVTTVTVVVLRHIAALISIIDGVSDRLPGDWGWAGTAETPGNERSPRPIRTITSIDRLASTISYTYLRRQHGFRSKNLPKFVSRNSG
jgi:hypothetical protein